MFLLRQLLLSVTVAMTVILVGTSVFSVNGARDYLNAQLQAESDNAATSLALSLSQAANQDPAMRELLITALFDSGRYHAIELRDTQGRELISRRVHGMVSQASVPDWFSRMLPLRAPHATRQVMDGWTQVGELTVIADDSEARLALWDSSIRVLAWVVLAGVLWLVFVVLLLRWLRRALHDEITRQVESIADGQAVVPGKTHRQVADLLPASDVMTQARERVQASRQEADRRIESLTLELNHDAVTGVPNRRYFMNELRRALHGPEQPDPDAQGGYILLCRQRDLGAIAAALPRDQVDAWLRNVGDQLQKTLAGITDAGLHLGRLNGSDFAVLIPGVEGPQAMQVAQAVRRTLLESRINVTAGHPCRWAFAMTDFVTSDDLSRVFARLDTALMAAESAGHHDIESRLSTDADGGIVQGVAGEAAWRTLLTDALSSNHLGLAVHRANYGKAGKGPDRYESTLTLTDPGRVQDEPLSGFSFMPAAVRLGLSAQFDLQAVGLAIGWLAGNPGELVVRVSAPSLLAPEFMQSLRETLGVAPPAGPDSNAPVLSAEASEAPRRLFIELDAYSLAAYPAEVAELCQIAQVAGVRVGLRGVAQQLDVVARLQGLPIAYIKLGGGFVADLETSQGAVSLLNAVVHTATALRIQLLADDTPGEVAVMLLKDHGVLLPTD